MSKTLREIGLFCGTFNPIHVGHLLMAESARDQFELERVLFVTSATPPHRETGLLPSRERHEMVVAALSGNAFFEASTLELDRPGPSYTADTVLALSRAEGAGARINLIVGEDNLPYISQWHRAAELLANCRLLVAPRNFPTPNPKYESRHPESLALPEGDIELLDFPLIPISASVIRDRLRLGRSVKYMVTTEVEEILIRKGHYRDVPLRSV